MKRRDLFKGMLALAVAPFFPKVFGKPLETEQESIIRKTAAALAARGVAPWPERLSITEQAFREVEESDRRVQIAKHAINERIDGLASYLHRPMVKRSGLLVNSTKTIKWYRYCLDCEAMGHTKANCPNEAKS